MSQTNPEFDNNKIPIQKLWQVILASSVGTVIEWYDFYIFGSLSAIISLSFFQKTTQPPPFFPPSLPSARALSPDPLGEFYSAGSAIKLVGNIPFYSRCY